MPDLFNIGINLSADPTNVIVNELVEKAMAQHPQPPRRYLGASIIGESCNRKIQYLWWCSTEVPARVRLIFDRGHGLEAGLRAQLEKAGFVFATEGLEFEVLDGVFKGHVDGRVIAAPRAPGLYLATPFVWECKAVNAKNFRAIDKRGLLAVFPKYNIQISVYQRFLNLRNPALASIVNADTCDVIHFVVRYDEALADQTIERAKLIVDATRRGVLLPRAYSDPEDWRCRMCAHHKRCWGALLPKA